jgi:hypothetical protein
MQTAQPDYIAKEIEVQIQVSFNLGLNHTHIDTSIMSS